MLLEFLIFTFNGCGISVLILIVLEDALGDYNSISHKFGNRRVLILIVLEDALGGLSDSTWRLQAMQVLILIVLEDALGAHGL